ncbi:putative leucine-rich repeat receptor-like serine/threonine-protein kinase At2g19230 isoform X3 [Vigna angularis]|uniref:putative leucine-rich repeat receptor-like serine/threonine-protein kinase At2g19230 isoform X3 n=1 Tax=Phaseolus angularis TaxID=3914 RepID=UPI0022B59F0D|nr:putative leucine-rich repeat receptor-like serine/threonine-protein kinase At2g19230 isoform X3 [Vigna angularis]
MERALQWIVVVAVCASSTINRAAGIDETPHRKLANVDYSDVISIDCGVKEGYIDLMTSIQYQDDDIEFGEIHTISNNSFETQAQINKQLTSLRSFPEGKRNCYSLKPKQGKNKRYIVRGYFAYGNYDNKTIYTSLTDTIDFCLVNVEQGVPFISLLELWPLGSAYVYQDLLNLQTLDLLTRVTLGVSYAPNQLLRYMDDEYGRSWLARALTRNEKEMSTELGIDLDTLNDPYKLPTEVLNTAVRALRLSDSVNIWRNYADKSFEYKVYLHFFDFEERVDSSEKRIMNVLVNGFGEDVQVNVTKNVSLSYKEVVTLQLTVEQGMGINNIFIKATSDSHLPAMLNAYEIYRVVPQSVSPTHQDDVDAIKRIKDIYKISRMKWQGDPCGPTGFTWDGLTCNARNPPRIISLNLSSSKLSGNIDVSFSNLANLEILDLSNNQLVGEVPEFFAKLSQLKILNLSRNSLTGPIPDALVAKSKSNSLQLSLEGNTDICLIGSCKKKKNIVTLVATIVASIVVSIIIVGIIMIWRSLRRNEGGISSTSRKDQLKLKNQTFSYSEIHNITNGFETMIGKGGFGEVYLGTLQSGERVAVKKLSLSSKQGYKEFKSEAKFLTLVHHRNVVSFVGYCDEGDAKALIYEYLSKGNLQEHLSACFVEKSSSVLGWKERVEIALDAASGLDYLHNGCKPPIIHRDLKGSNILLDENMRAKISDFGLSRTFANDSDTHVLTNYPGGTPGYLDPEFHSSGTLNKRSDVYSFGVVLLELITGQAAIRGTPEKPSHIHTWVKQKVEGGDIKAIVDPRLEGNYHVASAWKFLEIAMSCLPDIAIQRPDISHVTSELKDCLHLEASLQRTVSNNRDSFLMDSVLIDFSESDICPNPR